MSKQRVSVIKCSCGQIKLELSYLPIQKHFPEIKDALDIFRCAVIKAPPGAGKTTRVPLALIDEPWLMNKKIIVLEPRRLAAISCATHMADILKEKVGQTIGYRIRLDRKISQKTRIEVVTEGIFTRKIQNDPSLENIGLVIFDEFHERSIHSDLGLALCLDSFEALRNDLRLLVMSATMNVNAVSSLLGNAPVITSKGKSFPVKTIYIPDLDKKNERLSKQTACAMAIKRSLSEASGDVLVFLPGVKEIKRLYSILKKNLDSKIHVSPLYGNLPVKDQAKVFQPSKPGERKIVLATSIAETSITIRGIGIVIDAGLMRIAKFSGQTGMDSLITIPVSKASADQRRGRAGRTAKGVCYRLWSQYEHQLLKPFTGPEILSADLSPVVLELAAWGVSDPGQLKWIDLPDENSFEIARNLLKKLDGLDEQGKITSHGKKMVSAGLHPRLAHMIIVANEKGQGLLACRIAALLNERDIIQTVNAKIDPDIRFRLEIIEAMINKQKTWQKEFMINKRIIQRVLTSEKKLARDFSIKPSKINIEKAGTLIAHAYPDRIAIKRNNHNNAFLMATGKGAFFSETSHLSMSDYIVAIQLDGNPKDAKIFLGAPYSRKDLEQDFYGSFKTVHTLKWDKKTRSIKAKDKTLFGALVVKQRLIPIIDPDKACDIMIQEIQKAGLGRLPWTKKLMSFKERTVFLRNTGLFPDLPDVSDDWLKEHMESWLKPFISGVFSLKKLNELDLGKVFESMMTWEQKQTIEKMAPSHITIPSGSKKPLRYHSKNLILDSPVLEVRLQEMFGLSSTPKIANQTIPITLCLLSPAGRPVQVTKDLESFWKNTYKDVKKDLMGRYPKHFWPDDPLKARPTNRVKPKKGHY